ncbi:MAG: hypothetical protein A2Z25_08440 [Planctomycetes bacterium RBG_16_55_9]|nr:MAG: hypothetical protein A2Z25_08440 [Planctomycetes bacterium RBG_16_55_9]
MLIILGCAAFQYFKGTVLRAFATVIAAICAGMIAFGFFEMLANVFISRGDDSRFISLVPWAQTLCFILLFVLAFALLQTGITFLTRQPADLGFLPERIGRVICGILLGLLMSGFLLTAFQMAPLPADYPYKRFDPAKLEVDSPNRVLFNADGFVTGLLGILSNGSFSGKRNFAMFHPDYLDQLFFNRLIRVGETSIVSSITPAIEVPKPAAWPASEAIRQQADRFVEELRTRGGKLAYENDGKTVPLPVSAKAGGDTTIVRIAIKRRAIRRAAQVNGGAFTPSQLRLICTRKGSAQEALAGEGTNVYPLGFLKSASEIQICPEIKVGTNDFQGNADTKEIDFVFRVPNGFEPVLVQYKLNTVVEIPPRAFISADQAPSPATFTPSASSDDTGGNAGRPQRAAQQRQTPPEEGGEPSAPGARPGGRGGSGRSIREELDQ